jgi:hypothetical protein
MPGKVELITGERTGPSQRNQRWRLVFETSLVKHLQEGGHPLLFDASPQSVQMPVSTGAQFQLHGDLQKMVYSKCKLLLQS